MYHASDGLRGWGLEGALYKLGGLSNHHRHRHCRRRHDHDRNFLEEGNLGLYICILKEEIEPTWV